MPDVPDLRKAARRLLKMTVETKGCGQTRSGGFYATYDRKNEIVGLSFRVDSLDCDVDGNID